MISDWTIRACEWAGERKAGLEVEEGVSGRSHEEGRTMSMWPRENRPEDTHTRQSKLGDTQTARNTGWMAGMKVRIAQNLPSVGV